MTLKEYIESKGINKAWLARKLEIPQSTLAHYLGETRTMPQDVSDKIKQIIEQ